MTESNDMTGLARTALDHLKQGELALGSHWEAAHEICQAYEDVQIMNRIHALCHRIEGDIPNAGYWDRMGGQETPTGTLTDEWNGLNQFLAEA
ncbi:hypothetical protein AB9F29_15615 [Falsihalocynthiibacter sp. S25ZX9]|uniref:hypothetical protein n=1 Tax=Falsihalocynthiibacter sp. S25ZX9 TaxID=3240870 RepID=UPI003510B2E0